MHFPSRSTTLILLFAAFYSIISRDASGDDASQQGLAKIAPRMREFVDAGQISGGVTLVVHRGKIAHFEAVGEADIATHRPMTRDTLFGIASMTKPITATAVMILQDEGKLSIDDPVSKYIPNFKDARLSDAPPQREITIRDVLTHASGLTGNQKVVESLEKTADELAKRPLKFEPGTKWEYSPGLNVCGRIVEVVSKQEFEEFLTERILSPLKMTDTTFRPTPDQWKRVAVLYKPTEDKKTIEPAASQPGTEAAPANPSGGLFSTAEDMARFYLTILNGGELDGLRIVSKEFVRQMTTVQTGELVTGFTPGNGWGLGWCVVRQPQETTKMLSPGTFGHGGAWGTQGWVDPKTETIFVLMIQRANFGNSDASEIRRDFQQIAVDALPK